MSVKRVARRARRGIRKTLKPAKNIAGDLAKLPHAASRDISNAGEKIVRDSGRAVRKAVKKTGREAKRANRNVNTAAKAAAGFLSDQVAAVETTLSDADKRIRRGKLLDAIWHVAVDPLKHTEANTGKALSDAKLLNYVATAAASVYGGPKGAAAYAAWYTYHQTRDLKLALRAGAVAGCAAQGLNFVDGMPKGGTNATIKRTIASASISGAAVAASGGDHDAVVAGLFKGAAYTLAREHYSKVTDLEIEGKAPTEPAVAKLDPNVVRQFSEILDADGQPTGKIQITSMGKSISHVGLETANSRAPLLSFAETSPTMHLIAKIPYVNDMAYFHDQWLDVAQIKGLAVQATIIPAAVLVAHGVDAGIAHEATRAIIERDKQ